MVAPASAWTRGQPQLDAAPYVFDLSDLDGQAGDYAGRRCGALQTYTSFFVGILVGYILGVTAVALIDAIWFQGMGHVIQA